MWGSELSQTSLVLIFSSLWVAHPPGMGFDFIVIAPLLLSCSFSLVFGHEYLFFGEFQSPPADSCSAAGCILVLLHEEMSACPSTLPSGINLSRREFFQNKKLIENVYNWDNGQRHELGVSKQKIRSKEKATASSRKRECQEKLSHL